MLIRPKPFPNELDRGYLGQIMRINGKTSDKETLSLIGRWASEDGATPLNASQVELLSRVAGISTKEFVRRHTTLPLRRAITSYFPHLEHGSEEEPDLLVRSGIRPARQEAYFCPKCVRHELRTCGQSYWHRSHQIPGLLWCQKHSCALSYVGDMEKSFLHPPSSFLESATAVDSEWAEEVMTNTTVRRYIEICERLMQKEKPIGVKAILGPLRERAREMGFRTHQRTGEDPLISDEVIARCGRTWLKTVHPALANKEDGQVLHQLDGVLYLSTSASSSISYVLVCAVLYSSVNEALQAIEEPSEFIRKPRRAVEIAPAELEAAYIRASGDHNQIAVALGLPRASVSRRLEQHGLPHLSVSGALGFTSEALVEFFFERRSIADCASRHKVAPALIEQLVRSVGAPFIRVLQQIKQPTRGLGTGKRRLQKMSPGEAQEEMGRAQAKVGHHARPKPRTPRQEAAMDAQKVAQKLSSRRTKSS